jgi:hypothetical protein
MKEKYNQILATLTACEKNRDHFHVPTFDNVTVSEVDNETKGATLFDRTTILTLGNEKIVINEVSKDATRTFQNNPDKNIVNVSYFVDDKEVEKKSFYWEDKI